MLFILGNKRSEAAEFKFKYIKEFDAKLLNNLMTLQVPEKNTHQSARVQYNIRSPQKRFLSFKPDLNALENHVHNKLVKHNPSLRPYAREIQFDLQLFLWYMKLMKMSAGPNGLNFDGRLTNRNEFKRGFHSFLFHIRDTLAKYKQSVKQITKDFDDALRRLGMVKKRHYGSK